MSGSEVREMGVSEARANMTEVIAEARLLDVDFVLTRREKPQAVLMSVKRYEQAQADARVTAALKGTFSKLSRQELEANPLFLDFMKQFFDVDSD